MVLKLHIPICLHSSFLPTPTFASHTSTILPLKGFLSQVTFITWITCDCQGIMNSVVKSRLVGCCSVHMAAIWFNCTGFPPLVALFFCGDHLEMVCSQLTLILFVHGLSTPNDSVKIYSTPELPPQRN